MRNELCVVIPVLNEAKTVLNNLAYLSSLQKSSHLIFIDGKSHDQTVELLKSHRFNVLTSATKGRGGQISHGTVNVPKQCENILFLHIDTKLPANYAQLIQDALVNHAWGHFSVQFDTNKWMFKVIQFMMNKRSKFTGIATGDQAIFVSKELFSPHLNRVSEHPLMEDIFISKTLKKHHGRAHIIERPVITSVRYWAKHGIIKTVIKMWVFRFLYFFGMSPKKLYRLYYQ